MSTSSKMKLVALAKSNPQLKAEIQVYLTARRDERLEELARAPTYDGVLRTQGRIAELDVIIAELA